MILATSRGGAFGSAHSAIIIHGIIPSDTAETDGIQGKDPLASFMEQFDGHFGALSNAANGSTIAIGALTTANNTQYNKILAAMAELKTLSITVVSNDWRRKQ